MAGGNIALYLHGDDKPDGEVDEEVEDEGVDLADAVGVDHEHGRQVDLGHAVQPVVAAADVEHDQVHDGQHGQVDTGGRHALAQLAHDDQREDVPDGADEEQERRHVDVDVLRRALLREIHVQVLRVHVKQAVPILVRHVALRVIAT